MGSFSITLSRGTVEQELVGVAGNYTAQGSLGVEGSLEISKLDAAGNSDFLNSILDGTGTNKWFAVSANVGGGNATDALRFTLASCNVTGWDVSVGNADTITTASIDFVVANPYDLKYRDGGLVYG